MDTVVETPNVPYRQIRALYDDKTITVYQAYSASIAIPAVRSQRLNASPDFILGRMTWIKPSWCWIMYRSGYSTKDPNQSHILALKMTHQNFQTLLSLALVTDGKTAVTEAEARAKPVRVQWDPERGPRLEGLPYRSIQIGIGRALSRRWVEEWIDGIEDVTERALGLRKAVEDSESKLEAGDLVERGLLPIERVYEVSEELRRILQMI